MQREGGVEGLLMMQVLVLTEVCMEAREEEVEEQEMAIYLEKGGMGQQDF